MTGHDMMGSARVTGPLRDKRIIHLGMEFRGFTPANFKLGNIIRTLAEYQARNGAKVRIYIPRTKDVEAIVPSAETHITIHGHDARKVTISTVTLPMIDESAPEISVMLVGNEALFGSQSLYEQKDNWIYPWSIYAQAVLEHLRVSGFKPDAIHCHEWQSGLLPMYFKVSLSMAERRVTDGMRVVYSSHDIKQLGLFPADQWKYVGLPWDIFTHHWAEYFGQVCLLKAGMSACKVIFDSKEQLESALTRTEPRGIADFIRDKMARKRIACATNATFNPDNITDEYCADVTAAYFPSGPKLIAD